VTVGPSGPLRAVLLVGGFGTRLRPLTWHTPKQMLPVVGVTMLERVVARLGDHGVTEAVLSLGYRPDAFMDAFPDGTCAGVTLRYAVEPEPLDTAGAIRFAALDAGIDERFVAVNGDILTDFDLRGLLAAHEAAHRSHGAEGTIHLTPVEDPSRYGVVPLHADGRVQAFIEKPARDEAPSNWINGGCYVLEPSVLDRIPGGRKVSIERETFPAMVADGTLYAVQDGAYWIDAGTPEAYLQAQLDLIDGVRGDPEQAVAPDAQVAADATVERSVILSGARIGSGAKVRDSIVLPGAAVGSGSEVADSIIGPRSVVGSDASLRDLTVLGEAVTVEDGAELSGARLPVEG
jgi:mannose-1-phosphate guanylyltransferase